MSRLTPEFRAERARSASLVRHRDEDDPELVAANDREEKWGPEEEAAAEAAAEAWARDYARRHRPLKAVSDDPSSEEEQR